MNEFGTYTNLALATIIIGLLGVLAACVFVWLAPKKIVQDENENEAQ